MNITASNTQVNSVSGQKLPRTLIEAVRYFSDPQVCIDYIARLRWPDGPVCPSCGGTEHSYLSTRRVWKCRGCKRQFSVKVGTIFEQSPLGLEKWLPAVWLLANSKNGVSSHELARALGITQKSAWHLDHRIREAMRVGTFEQFRGETEVDETYVGGRADNKHKSKKKVPYAHKKVIVAGALNRSDDGPSQVRASVIPNTWHGTMHKYVNTHVAPGSKLYTDAHASYQHLNGEYEHAFVNHKIDEYVRDRVSTNGLENFWSLLKRGLTGTYVVASEKHMDRYVDERVFTFNERGRSDFERFELVLRQSIGRRVTWEELVSANA